MTVSCIVWSEGGIWASFESFVSFAVLLTNISHAISLFSSVTATTGAMLLSPIWSSSTLTSASSSDVFSLGSLFFCKFSPSLSMSSASWLSLTSALSVGVNSSSSTLLTLTLASFGLLSSVLALASPSPSPSPSPLAAVLSVTCSTSLDSVKELCSPSLPLGISFSSPFFSSSFLAASSSFSSTASLSIKIISEGFSAASLVSVSMQSFAASSFPSCWLGHSFAEIGAPGLTTTFFSFLSASTSISTAYSFFPSSSPTWALFLSFDEFGATSFVDWFSPPVQVFKSVLSSTPSFAAVSGLVSLVAVPISLALLTFPSGFVVSTASSSLSLLGVKPRTPESFPPIGFFSLWPKAASSSQSLTSSPRSTAAANSLLRRFATIKFSFMLTRAWPSRIMTRSWVWLTRVPGFDLVPSFLPVVLGSKEDEINSARSFFFAASSATTSLIMFSSSPDM